MAAKDNVSKGQFYNRTFFFMHGSPEQNLKELDPKSETMAERVASDPPFEERWPEHMLNESRTALKREHLNSGQLYGYNVSRPNSQRMLPKEDLEGAIKDSMGYGENIYIGLANTRNTEWQDDPNKYSAEVLTGSKIPVMRKVKTSMDNPEKGVKDTIKALKELGLREED